MQIKKVFRQERKFLISGEQYYRFSRQFAELFKEDSHYGTFPVLRYIGKQRF